MTDFGQQQQQLEPWPVFVLTLKGDEARRTDLINSLIKNSISHQLVFGVDGRTGLPQECEKLIDRPTAKRRYQRPLSDAEFACALSHRAIYSNIVSEGLSGAVILEDDAILTDAFIKFVEKRLYLRSDLILLDHSHARVTAAPTQLSEDISMRRLSLPASLTTAYSLSSAAASYLLGATSPLSDVADWPGDITELGALACHPTVVKHSDPAQGGSHIRASRTKTRPSPFRFMQRAYWRVWVKKRMSEQIG